MALHGWLMGKLMRMINFSKHQSRGQKKDSRGVKVFKDILTSFYNLSLTCNTSIAYRVGTSYAPFTPTSNVFYIIRNVRWKHISLYFYCLCTERTVDDHKAFDYNRTIALKSLVFDRIHNYWLPNYFLAQPGKLLTRKTKKEVRLQPVKMTCFPDCGLECSGAIYCVPILFYSETKQGSKA